jgi:hypothetical protein
MTKLHYEFAEKQAAWIVFSLWTDLFNGAQRIVDLLPETDGYVEALGRHIYKHGLDPISPLDLQPFTSGQGHLAVGAKVELKSLLESPYRPRELTHVDWTLVEFAAKFTLEMLKQVE